MTDSSHTPAVEGAVDETNQASNGEPTVLDATSHQSESDTLLDKILVHESLPERTCPACDIASPGDSQTCYICGFNFVTNRKALAEESEATSDSFVHAHVLSQSTDTADGASPGSPLPDDPTEVAGTPVTRVEPALRRSLQPNPDAVVYAVAMPAPTGKSAISSDDRGAATQPTFELAKDSKPATTSITAAPGVASAGGLGVEPSALSIPSLNVVHPSTPHVVLVVDHEARRSRPSTEQVPPERDAEVIPLTLEAHAFGRSIKSCCLDFDRAASGLHGFFQIRDDGGYAIRDESKNGTKVNGVYIEKGTATPLKNGDVITLGVWTKIIYWDGTPAQADRDTSAIDS